MTFTPGGDIKGRWRGPRGNGAQTWLVVSGLLYPAAALGASKWNGFTDFFVVWICIALVVGQRFLRRPALYGNPYWDAARRRDRVDVRRQRCDLHAIATSVLHPHHNYVDMVTLQREMYGYHANLKATHPYASSWWQWPILERPISYFYTVSNNWSKR